MQKRVSIKDVADKVGVSVALVSYVLNGQEKEKRVGPKIAQSIRKAAKELNYQPNEIARSLRMKSTKTIGLLTADISNPFFSNLASIIEDEATKFGYTVIFGSSAENAEKLEALITTLRNRQIDGLIISPPEGSMAQIARLISEEVPVVLMDRHFPEIDVSHVILDNFQATYDATSHLINSGFSDISMLCYRTNLAHMSERKNGYKEALIQYTYSEKETIFEFEPNLQAQELQSFLKKQRLKRKDKKALIFATNTLAVSGIYSLQKLGLKIPEDVSFIGFDGGEGFDLHNPPLSFIQQPLEEMGREAFGILLDLINGSKKISKVMLKPSLILR